MTLGKVLTLEFQFLISEIEITLPISWGYCKYKIIYKKVPNPNLFIECLLLLLSIKTIIVVTTIAEDYRVNHLRFLVTFLFQRTAMIKTVTKVIYFKLNVIFITNLKLLIRSYKCAHKLLRMCVFVFIWQYFCVLLSGKGIPISYKLLLQM